MIALDQEPVGNGCGVGNAANANQRVDQSGSWSRRQPIQGSHHTQLLGAGINPYDLNEGDRLSFDLGTDKKNRQAAINVRLSQ